MDDMVCTAKIPWSRPQLLPEVDEAALKSEPMKQECAKIAGSGQAAPAYPEIWIRPNVENLAQQWLD